VCVASSDLPACQAIGQWDTKVIMAVCRPRHQLQQPRHLLLVAFDQHAVHERVLLEHLAKRWSRHPRRRQCSRARLQSASCRAAIRFGDILRRRECAELLSLLRHCSAPFQCAHGRQAVWPIARLNPLIDEGKGDAADYILEALRSAVPTPAPISDSVSGPSSEQRAFSSTFLSDRELPSLAVDFKVCSDIF
ncbi:hypothetical protein BOX15_Mlig028803g2, partial [Macrostomum lignano]